MNFRLLAIPSPISYFSRLLPSPDSSFAVVHSWVICIMRLSPFDPSVSEMRALGRSYGWQIIKLSALFSMHCKQKKIALQQRRFDWRKHQCLQGLLFSVRALRPFDLALSPQVLSNNGVYSQHRNAWPFVEAAWSAIQEVADTFDVFDPSERTSRSNLLWENIFLTSCRSLTIMHWLISWASNHRKIW